MAPTAPQEQQDLDRSQDTTSAVDDQVVAEELVEDVSIDGMCGVY